MRRVAPVLAAVIVLAVASAAVAGGGSSIAAAPELPLGQQQLGAPRGIDYWHVTLGGLDQLIVDYGYTGSSDQYGGKRLEVCVVKPDVTDYTLKDARCATWNALDGGKAHTEFIAPIPGRWTVMVGKAYDIGYGGCFSDDEIYPTCQHETAYEITAYVKHYTQTSLSGPATAPTGTRVSLAGTVRGAVAGGVELQYRSRGWHQDGVAKLRPDGTFAYRTTRLAGTPGGTFVMRAVYRGDAQHRSSVSNLIRIRAN